MEPQRRGLSEVDGAEEGGEQSRVQQVHKEKDGPLEIGGNRPVESSDDGKDEHMDGMDEMAKTGGMDEREQILMDEKIVMEYVEVLLKKIVLEYVMVTLL